MKQKDHDHGFNPNLLGKGDEEYDRAYMEAVLDGRTELQPVVDRLRKLPPSWTRIKEFREINKYLPYTKSKSVKIRMKLASSMTLPESITETLSKDQDRSVRCEIVMNQKTPHRILKTLASDRSPFVRECVARNPNTPIESLEKLSKEISTKRYVAENPRTPIHILERLAKEGVSKKYVAENIDVTSMILKELSMSDDPIVSGMATNTMDRIKER